MPRTRLLLAGMPAAALSLIAVSATTADAQISGEVTSARSLLEEMRQYYDELLPDTRPETVRGSGYKPFKRYEWFMETRMGTGDEIEPGARLRAFEKMKEMEAQQNRGGLPTWFNLGPTNVAGRCLAIAVHPTNGNIAYAGFASSGIWKTTDAGATWTPLGDTLPSMSVSAIALDESNPNTIWIGTGEGWGNVDALHGVGLLKSTDAGLTWQTTGYTYDLASGLDVFMLEYEETTGVLLLAAENGLWRSTDGGDTFTEPMPSGDWRDVKLKPGTTDTYYAISRGWAGMGVYVSTDEGVTWTRLENGAPITGINNGRIALTPADPEVIYWSNDNPGAGITIYRSTDGGASWTQRFNGAHDGGLGQGWYDLTIAVSPLDENIVYSGGVSFYRSTNGGTSFSQIANNVHVDHHATTWDPSDPNVFWVGTDGGVYRSINGGSSYSPRNSGLVTLQYYAMGHSYTDVNLAFGGTQDNGTWRYTGGPAFGQVYGADGFECEVAPDNLLVFIEIYNGDHYRSTNGGNGFVPANTGINEDGPWQTPTHMDYSNQARVWTGHNQQIWRTTNSGVSWSSVMPTGLGGGRSIDQCYTQPQYVWCVGGTRVFLSTDTGASFTQVTGTFTSANTINDVTVHPTDGLTAMVCMGSYSASVPNVVKTTDGGVTWVDMTNNLPGEGCQSITYDYDDPSIVFLGTDLGCYVSFDGGGNWQPFNVGLPNVICDDVKWHPDGLLRVGTHGRGMWEVDISDLQPPTSVEQTAEQVQPLTLRVIGNPVVSGATPQIRFGLREAGRAKLGLYDTNGRLVRMLLDRDLPARVDYVDVDVAGLHSGVYFARFESNGQSVTQKLVIEQ